MNFRKLFLPGGLVIALLWGLLFPTPGAWLYQWDCWPVTPKMLCVVGVFLVMGYQLDVWTIRWGWAFVRSLVAALGVNLLLAPLLAVVVVTSLGLASDAALGLFITACVPTTLSSAAVITRSAGGNEAWAVSMIVLLNTIGVFFLAFTLAWCLAAGGIDIPERELLLEIVRMVVVPIALGQAVRQAAGYRPHTVLDYTPSALVIIMAWMAISNSHAALWTLDGRTLALLTAACAAFHTAMLLASLGAGRALRLARPDLLALLFVGAQKTLPIALTVLIVVTTNDPALAPLLGTATVVCVLHHFLQINADSLIAALVPRE